MSKVLTLALAFAALAGTAHAQMRDTSVTAEQALTTSRTGIPFFNPDQGSADIPASQPYGVFGVPVRVSAPVNTPYAPSALQTFAGQPMLGRDAVVARGFGSE